MRDARLYTGKTKSGGFKAFILGRVEKFGNERMLTVEGQPHRGFERREQAAKHARDGFPSVGSFTAWAAAAKGDGQFVSEERKKDLMLEPVYPETPTGPTMPLATMVPPPRHGKRTPPSPKEARGAPDATIQLPVTPGLVAQFQASAAVAEPAKKETVSSERMTPVLDDAQEELALRKFATASEAMSKFLRHDRRIKLLVSEHDALWAELVTIFGSEDLARVMVERANGLVGAWNITTKT